MLKEIEYRDSKGKMQKTAYIERGSAYQLTGNREAFCQAMAQGKSEIDAYCQSHGIEVSPENLQEVKAAGHRLLRDTSIVLRIQDLKRPVLRKLQKKIEYTQEKALEQCAIAWDLAYAQADVKGMLAASKLQAELCKLLVQQIDVKHTHEELDNASTAVLMEMLKTVQVRQANQKQLLEKAITVEPVDSPTPHQAAFLEAEMVPSEAV